MIKRFWKLNDSLIEDKLEKRSRFLSSRYAVLLGISVPNLWSTLRVPLSFRQYNEPKQAE